MARPQPGSPSQARGSVPDRGPAGAQADEPDPRSKPQLLAVLLRVRRCRRSGIEVPELSEPDKKERRGVNGGEAVLGDGRKVELADFPERVAARLLDPVVAFLLVLAALIITLVDSFLSSFCGECVGLRHVAVRRTSLIASLVVFLFFLAYERTSIGASGQTRGKRRLHIRVVNRADGKVPSPAKAHVRSLVPAAAGIAGSVGGALADLRVPALAGLALWFVVYVSAVWGRNGRGWHDMAAGTIVINDPAPQQSQTEESRL